jgi:hypothetical protein
VRYVDRTAALSKIFLFERRAATPENRQIYSVLRAGRNIEVSDICGYRLVLNFVGCFGALNKMAAKMTPPQLVETQRMVREWVPKT